MSLHWLSGTPNRRLTRGVTDGLISLIKRWRHDMIIIYYKQICSCACQRLIALYVFSLCNVIYNVRPTKRETCWNLTSLTIYDHVCMNDGQHNYHTNCTKYKYRSYMTRCKWFFYTEAKILPHLKSIKKTRISSLVIKKCAKTVTISPTVMEQPRGHKPSWTRLC